MKCKAKYTTEINGLDRSKVFTIYKNNKYYYNIKNGIYNVNIEKRNVSLSKNLFFDYFINIK